MLSRATALAVFFSLSGCGLLVTPPIASIPTRDNPECTVSRIVDGDTVDISCRNLETVTARLIGYDTPETFRPSCPAEFRAGQEAKRLLENTLRQATLVLPRFEGADRFGRALVSLTLDGEPLADLMVATGFAVPYDGRSRRIDWCARLAI